MNRLTKRLSNGVALLDCNNCELRKRHECEETSCRDQLIDRLAAYEDTGLTSAEVHSMYSEWKAMMSVLNSIGGYDRLRELAEADKAGRCVVLPCKPGDTVYQIRKKTHARGMGISPRIVSSACVWADGSYALTHQGMLYCQSGDMGKTWFLTREEAEKALQEMKE